MNTYQLSALLAGLLLPLSALAQGPLPPPGAPGPTMKTLDQLDAHVTQAGEKRIPISALPFDIAKPGSYYLTQDVSGAPGINVTVSGVTINLNGFSITGVGKNSSVAGSGIVGLNDTVVRNGRVSDFAGDGIRLGAAAVVENVDVANVSGVCITVGEQSHIARCRVGAGNQGIVVGLASIIDSCLSTGNVGTNPGIQMGPFGTISNSLASYNAGDGINAGSSSAITNCVVANNTGNGIVASTGSKVNECTSRSNKGIGINVGSQSTVKRCTVSDYSILDGIRASNQCAISENHIVGNLSLTGGAALHITGTNAGNCRIESNEVMQVYRGIQVDSAGNLIIKNSVGGGISSKYQIAANNAVGVIVTTSSGAVDGSGGGSGLGTPDPWANLSY